MRSRCVASSQLTPLASPPDFFISRECHDQVVRRLETLVLQAYQSDCHGHVLALHVDDAAAVQPAVVLRQLERVVGPVFALSLDDVEMTDIENGVPLPTAAEAHDEITLGRMIGGRQ